MTGRERIVAASRGGDVDRKPVIGIDAVIVDPNQVSERSGGDAAVLARVLSPLGRAIKAEIPIVALLHEDVEQGAKTLDRLTDEAKSEMLAALANGADGVAYELDGAYPAVTTPMEYGGHFLEVDRKLLAELVEARFNLLCVKGEQEPYIDFVCDLPAHGFAWDQRSGVTPEYVRSMRDGVLVGEGCEIGMELNDCAGVGR